MEAGLVTEPTAEIGIRKARRLIGIVCGAAVAVLVHQMVPFVPATSSVANLDPVLCLRYE